MYFFVAVLAGLVLVIGGLVDHILVGQCLLLDLVVETSHNLANGWVTRSS